MPQCSGARDIAHFWLRFNWNAPRLVFLVVKNAAIIWFFGYQECSRTQEQLPKNAVGHTLNAPRRLTEGTDLWVGHNNTMPWFVDCLPFPAGRAIPVVPVQSVMGNSGSESGCRASKTSICSCQGTDSIQVLILLIFSFLSSFGS